MTWRVVATAALLAACPHTAEARGTPLKSSVRCWSGDLLIFNECATNVVFNSASERVELERQGRQVVVVGAACVVDIGGCGP